MLGRETYPIDDTWPSPSSLHQRYNARVLRRGFALSLVYSSGTLAAHFRGKHIHIHVIYGRENPCETSPGASWFIYILALLEWTWPSCVNKNAQNLAMPNILIQFAHTTVEFMRNHSLLLLTCTGFLYHRECIDKFSVFYPCHIFCNVRNSTAAVQ